MIGLVVLAMIAGAIAGLTTAVAAGWRATEYSQSMQISTRQSATQLYRQLRSARYVSYIASDSGGTGAAMMLWRGNSAQPNNTSMRLCDIVLIEHDGPNKTLMLYQVPSTASNFAASFNRTDIDDAADAAAFKKVSNVTSQVLANNVAGARFMATYTGSTTQHQTIEFVLTYSVGGDSRTEYGTAVVRAPLVPN
jgi:hypothetical protein